MSSQLLFDYLKSLAVQSPLLLVCLVGLLVALFRWSRHPWASLWALLGFGLLLLSAVVVTGGQMWLVEALLGEDLNRWEWTHRILGFIRNGIDGVALALLMVGMFGGRSRAPHRPPYRLPEGPDRPHDGFRSGARSDELGSW